MRNVIFVMFRKLIAIDAKAQDNANYVTNDSHFKVEVTYTVHVSLRYPYGKVVEVKKPFKIYIYKYIYMVYCKPTFICATLFRKSGLW